MTFDSPDAAPSDGGVRSDGAARDASTGGDAGPPGTFCDADGFHPVRNLGLPNVIDYVGLFELVAGAAQPAVRDATGTPCASSHDPAACKQRFDQLAPPPGGWPGGVAGGQAYTRYVVTTAADVFTQIANDADLRGLLGPIDTVREAALVAELEVGGVGCNDVIVPSLRGG